jgi:cytochrome c oxidase subunit II
MNLQRLRFVSGFVTGAACIGLVMAVRAQSLPQPIGDTSSVKSAAIVDRPPFRRPGVYRLADGSFEVYVASDASNFYPDSIEVPAGRSVTFFVTSPHMVRGFSIAEIGVYMSAGPGWVETATHEFNTAGTFLLVCSEYCGLTHMDMHAVVNVYNPATPQIFAKVRTRESSFREPVRRRRNCSNNCLNVIGVRN